MIRDLAVGFQKAQEKFPDIIQHNYRLKEGLYIRLDLTKNWENQSEAFEQNHLTIIRKEEVQDSELLKWFKRQDYLSSLIDMNKPLDSKKQIHSNNPLALFMKREVFIGEKQEAKFTVAENIERYLLAAGNESVRQKWLEMLPQATRKISQALDFFQNSEYAEALVYLESTERSKLLEQIAEWHRTNIKELTAFVGQLPFKNYVKLFFTFPANYQSLSSEQVYELEHDLYTIPKIFNSNDYNEIAAGELVGLPSFDMTMNSKKPFLEHKTMRTQAPDRVTLQQAMLAKQATEWLAAAKPPYEMNKIGYESFIPSSSPLPPEGTFHVYLDGKYQEIYGYENVPFPPTTYLEIEYYNFLHSKDHKGYEKSYNTITTTEELQAAISSKFFQGKMDKSFILSEPDVKAKVFTAQMAALFMQSRQAFHDWFNKGTTISIQGLFAKVTFRLLVEQLLHVENARLTDLADAFNLRLSIQMVLDEKGGQIMADRISGTMDSLRGKLVSDKLAVCANDEEFYFMAGQLAHYLISQSKAQKITGEIYEPFLRAKNGRQLKKRLEEAYKLYKHEIITGYRRFNQAFSLVMGYDPQSDNRGSARELLLAGIFASNLLFEKTDKGAE